MADATVKVKLDTRAAKSDLRKLGKEGHASAGRVNEKLNRRSGGLGGGFALGAGVGAGFSALAGGARRLAGGPVGDVFNEATAGTRALFDEAFGGAKARAGRSVREEAKQIFATQVGITGDTTAAKEWAAAVLPFRQQVAEGAVQIEGALAPTAAETAETIKDGMKEASREFFDQAGQKLGEFIDYLKGLGG